MLEQGHWAYDDAGNITATGDASTMTTRSYDLNLNSLARIGGTGKIRVEGTMSAYSSVSISLGNGGPQKAVIRSNPAGGYRYEAEVEVQQGNNLITVTASLLDPVTGQPPVGAPQVVTQQYQYQASGISRNFSSSFSRLTEDKNGSYVILRKFDYDAKNRLKKVTVSGTVTEWDYDWADRRVRESQYPAGGSKPAWPAKLYIWDGTELVQERVYTSTSTYNSGGTVSRTHYFGGFNDGATLNGTKYQTTTDHLGNVRDVINASGALVARYDYTPWGKPTKVSGTTVNASLLINSRYYHHAASGLHLALYRAYDPDLGRWLSEDPLGEAGGLNLYRYVGNSPVMGVDPLGLNPGDIFPTYDAARTDALQWAYDQTKKTGTEHGGKITCNASGKFTYDGRDGGHASVAVDVEDKTTPLLNSQAQGYYHSHPAQNFVENIFGALSGLTNEDFSGYGKGSADPALGDRQWADRKCKPLSLVTPSGKMKTYNPAPAKAGNGTINNHGVVPKP